MIAHDGDLARMCGQSYAGKTIEEYAFADLPPMQREIPMHFATGNYKLQDEEDGKFTLLNDLFTFNVNNGYKNILYSIDMKSRSDELVQKSD